MNKIKNKSNRKAISLETKVKILESLVRNRGSRFVGKRFGLNEATIWIIGETRILYANLSFVDQNSVPKPQ